MYGWNAETHLVTNGGFTYLYDGDGKRVGKAPNGTPGQASVVYWYGAGSEVLMETNGSNGNQYQHVYFAGRRMGQTRPARLPGNALEHRTQTALVFEE